MSTHMQTINSSFADQAKEFENPNMNFSKKEYLDYTMRAIGAKETDTVLEAAAGTCVCGRTLAPMVQKVVCLDATQPMLNEKIKVLSGLTEHTIANEIEAPRENLRTAPEFEK